MTLYFDQRDSGLIDCHGPNSECCHLSSLARVSISLVYILRYIGYIFVSAFFTSAYLIKKKWFVYQVVQKMKPVFPETTNSFHLRQRYFACQQETAEGNTTEKLQHAFRSNFTSCALSPWSSSLAYSPNKQ